MFQFTRPAWGATPPQTLPRHAVNRVSIHAPRVGRDGSILRPAFMDSVSIHAPRVGRDMRYSAGYLTFSVSIHAPRVGRDSYGHRKYMFLGAFQFTRPAWGATGFRFIGMHSDYCFNSRAPRGARLRSSSSINLCSVSIHAPRVGRDIHPPR